MFLSLDESFKWAAFVRQRREEPVVATMMRIEASVPYRVFSEESYMKALGIDPEMRLKLLKGDVA